MIGFCWGGGQSFSYAAHATDLSAAVVYYGMGPKTKEDAEMVNTPVLGN